MEITNEIKAKVLFNYIGSACEYKWNREDDLLKGKLTPRILESLYYDDGIITHCIIKLKPLSAISDEDAIELVKISGCNYLIEGEAFEITGMSFTNWTKIPMAYQFLQSRGYDLPQYLLGGKTLHECNLAIYENTPGDGI